MLSRQQCRDADATAIGHFGIPGIVLMENAGRGCAELLLSYSQIPSEDQATLVLCGPGNNGGDGFVVARHLYNAGVKVKVVLFASGESYSGDALINLRALRHFQLPIVQFDNQWDDKKIESEFGMIERSETRWVVDAMLGTGAHGHPRAPFQSAIGTANEMDVQRFAIDLPSGLDCDSGEPSKTTFMAHVTGTFVDRKIGFQNPAATAFLGEVHVIGIGAPPEIVRIAQPPA
ncbi:MAG: NAD(P)H-hydrate epimerase [Mariniblastus sp.]|nr:NAD(P)H-hydrate epimerase [Mariniblastus sp.]